MHNDHSERVSPMLNPPHLGELVRESMEEAGWNITKTAGHLGCERGTLSRLLNGRAGMSANMALALEDIGWGTAEHWMRMQASYELAQACLERFPKRDGQVRNLHEPLSAGDVSRPAKKSIGGTASQVINFKDPKRITVWLDAALEKEKEKFGKCPVTSDVVPGYEAAQGWGYVIAGYFLAEESFKALLHARGKTAPRQHSLTTLFNMFDKDDQAILREYYADYRKTIGGNIGRFPLKSLDSFLANLDGDKDKHGNHVGSFDWRYFLIEEKKNQKMPLVCIEYMYEIVFGCARIIECVNSGQNEPSRYTHSWRMRWQRERKYKDWFFVRMNSEGWGDLSDRLEILWGPDYRGRYDLCLFKNKGATLSFSEVPEDLALPIVDKRKEVEFFDAEEGYESIGVTCLSHPYTD